MLALETAGSVLWMAMDAGWMLGWNVVATGLVLPCIAVHGLLFRYTPKTVVGIAVIASRVVTSSGVILQSTAPRLSSRCAIVREPMMTDVTPGRARSHCSAACGTVAPWFFATRSSASYAARARGPREVVAPVVWPAGGAVTAACGSSWPPRRMRTSVSVRPMTLGSAAAKRMD